MTAGTDGLRAQLRARKRPAPPPWVPPVPGQFRGYTPVLAWDATLTHCGWVVAEVNRRMVMIHDKGTINIVTELTGYLSTWDKARLLRPQVREVLDAWPTARVVVESPAVQGSRLESSLIAGMLIWLETVTPSGLCCPQISPNHVSAVLCGNGRLASADRKRAVREACARYVPGSETRAWNEHERDALAVGLTWLHDQHLRDGLSAGPQTISMSH